MPKLKNSKTVVKRIKKITSTGKILIRRMSAQHRMHGKNKKIKLRSKQSVVLCKGDYRRVERLAPTLK